MLTALARRLDALRIIVGPWPPVVHSSYPEVLARHSELFSSNLALNPHVVHSSALFFPNLVASHDASIHHRHTLARALVPRPTD